MLITHKHIEESFEYDGSQIEASWAFKTFGIKGSTIVTWIGSMNIAPNNLKDFEDIGLEIKSDKIINFIIEHFDEQPANLRIAYMRQRLLVVILKDELAKLGIDSIRKGDDIYIISKNDVYKKLTVSIATISPSSMKIHLGINLTSEGTPDDVDTVGLFELFENIDLNSNNLNNIDLNDVNLNNIDLQDINLNGVDLNNIDLNDVDLNNIDLNGVDLNNIDLNDVNLVDFINNIVKNYIDELNDIELDISKTNLI